MVLCFMRFDFENGFASVHCQKYRFLFHHSGALYVCTALDRVLAVLGL